MSNDVKQRRKAAAKPDGEAKEEPLRKGAKPEPLRKGAKPEPQAWGEKPPPQPAERLESAHFCPEPRTLLCLLSLSVCLASAWFAFQQSVTFADVENRYRLLEIKTLELQALEAKVGLLSEKLEASEGILSKSTVALISHLEQEVSGLRKSIRDIENKEETLSRKMQNINGKVENVTDSWKNSVNEMNEQVANLKSEARAIHNRVTAQTNKAERGLKLFSERLNELDDSTVRNSRALKRQEDDELLRVEQQLDSSTQGIEKLEADRIVLVAKSTELRQNIQDYTPKVEECRNHLPAIESAVRTVLKVSNEIIGMEKKMEDLTMQTFNMEDHMLKAVSDILGIQQTLEGMKYDNSILKMQNELGLLKERVYEYALTSSTKEVNLAENNSETTETPDND